MQQTDKKVTFKYKIPSNEQICSDFCKIEGIKNLSITKRSILDKNSFSCIEKVQLSNDKVYVLKTVADILQSEVLVHNYVNSFRINAPIYYFGKLRDTTEDSSNYIIMEFLENYLHLYNILEDELYFEAVRSLGELHLNSQQQLDLIKQQFNIPEYSVEFYIENVSRIVFELSRYAIKYPHPDYLPKELIAKFQREIPKIKKYLEEIKQIPLAVVHGDFDSGNIIYYKKNQGSHNAGSVKAIDWGHGHIGSPLIDIAHLVNSLGYIDYDTKITLIAEYLKTCRPLYTQNVPFSLLIIGGTIIHYLYHLNFKLRAIKEGYVEVNFFREQIHNRISQLLEILV